ncbi:SPOR domain-containing protein [Photobacterium phosphoreum]|uniref:SPOR domain-containing protein n=1 Tax=Photobacterium phosphoreum TaxID=659 RepID=UPI0024BBD603|nr:SPOR domain-containing protein [Photobacterium phosphoreum]
MKKIIALSLLSSLVGCAQLMPPKTPLQVPIETINTTKATDTFVEPTIVAELDASVKTDPLYESSDSIAVSEQAITEPEPAATNTETNTVTNTAASAPAETTEPAVTESQAVEPQAVTAEAAVNSAEITEPTPEAVSEVAATSTEANTVTNTAASAPAETTEPAVTEPAAVEAQAVESQAVTAEAAVNSAEITEPTPEAVSEVAATSTEANTVTNTAASVPAVTTEPAVTEPQAVEPQAVTAEAVVNSAEITEPTPEAVSEVAPVAETPTVEDDTSQTIDDSYKTVDMHGYSLQITASRDEQSLVTLLSTLESQQPAWINKKMLNGSQAYTLLVGHYADYDQAKSALALLPQAVQQNGAFVRNFYDIEHTGSPQLKQLQ